MALIEQLDPLVVRDGFWVVELAKFLQVTNEIAKRNCFVFQIECNFGSKVISNNGHLVNLLVIRDSLSILKVLL